MLGPALWWNVAFNRLLEVDFGEGVKRVAYADNAILVVYGRSGDTSGRGSNDPVDLSERAKVKDVGGKSGGYEIEEKITKFGT